MRNQIQNKHSPPLATFHRDRREGLWKRVGGAYKDKRIKV